MIGPRGETITQSVNQLIANNLSNVGTKTINLPSIAKFHIYEITQPSVYLPQTHGGILSTVREQKPNIQEKFK